jgi:hypothetical protein
MSGSPDSLLMRPSQRDLTMPCPLKASRMPGGVSAAAHDLRPSRHGLVDAAPCCPVAHPASSTGLSSKAVSRKALRLPRLAELGPGSAPALTATGWSWSVPARAIVPGSRRASRARCSHCRSISTVSDEVTQPGGDTAVPQPIPSLGRKIRACSGWKGQGRSGDHLNP